MDKDIIILREEDRIDNLSMEQIKGGLTSTSGSCTIDCEGNTGCIGYTTCAPNCTLDSCSPDKITGCPQDTIFCPWYVL